METSTQRTFREFKHALQQVAPADHEVSLDDRLDVIIPSRQRRRVWQQLRADGWELPELRLPAWVVLLSALVVSLIVALLVLSSRIWSALATLVDLSWGAKKLTRPWAVHPPIACETVREAVLRLTPFRREDYLAGLWPREDMAAKVRLIIAEVAEVPFAEIRGDTRLFDLIDC